MRRSFVESAAFTKQVERHGIEALRKTQAEILQDPTAGSVIQGTGGLRKLRVEDPMRGKGKRGGLRVIYLDLPGVERTHLLALYGKNEKDDISADEKKVLRALVEQIKKEAKR